MDMMAYFDPRRKTRLKNDAGPGGMAATMKPYDHQARRWRPVTYRSRTLMDTECRYSQLEKEAKAVEWGIFANQIYLYGLGDAFEVDTVRTREYICASDVYFRADYKQMNTYL